MKLKTLKIGIFSTVLLLASCDLSKKEPEQEIKPVIEKKITLKDLKFEKIISLESEFAEKGVITKSFFGLKNDSITVSFDSDSKIKQVVFIEERSGRVFKKFTNSNKFNWAHKIKIKNPFTINITFNEATYYNLDIQRKSATVENKLSKTKLVRDSVIVKKKTRRSFTGKSLKFEKLYNEPKKFIVSQKLNLSGVSKLYAPIEVPNKTVEFIYTLRISGKKDNQKNDGNLIDKVSTSHTKINMLGLPLWDSNSSGSSITREIVNSIFPPKKDDEFSLNVFFFDNQKEIKKFIGYNGTNHSSAFKYDLNNSALSTQSRVGLVKKSKKGFAYIGLESLSTWYDTYVWLDVVAMYEEPLYYEIRYNLKDL